MYQACRLWCIQKGGKTCNHFSSEVHERHPLLDGSRGHSSDVHNWQADMWSVGCTVIEMATGKPPWSQQFQEVAALFHIGTTNHTLPSLSIFLIKARIFSSSVSRGSPHWGLVQLSFWSIPLFSPVRIKEDYMILSTYNNKLQLMVICSSSRQIGETQNCDLWKVHGDRLARTAGSQLGCLRRVHPFLSEAPHTRWRILITSTGLPEEMEIQTWTTLIVLWGWTL